MTLATATLDRFATATAGLTPVTETPVTRNPTSAEARGHGANHLIYVTRTDSPSFNESAVGTVLRCHAANSQNGWLYESPNNGVVRVFGAVLNDPMVNGRYYRQLGNRHMLVQFHDEDHLGDRNSARFALNIVAAEGSPWPFPGDSMGAWDDDIPYIEVEGPAAPVLPAAEELTDAHQFADAVLLDAEGPARGFAEAEADGRVRLNPELEVGGMYIYWSANRDWVPGSMSEARVVLSIEDGEPRFGYLGYWTQEQLDGALTPYFYTSRRTVLDSDTEKAWVKLALTVPAPTNTDAARFERLLGAEASDFREFNDATNELAEDNDWCEEYEGIVQKLGMEGRTKTMHDYDVDVTASITFEVDSVSSRIDGMVADDYNIPGISLNSARLRGDVTVTIRVSDVEDGDAVEDQIDSDAVYEQINSMMSGADSLEIEDYNIGTARRID